MAQPQSGSISPLTSALAAAGAGAAVIGALAASGRLEIGPALGGALLVMGLGWLVGQRADAARALPAPAVEAEPGRSAPPPYASLVNALPDPVLVIAAHEPDDLAGRRFVLVNDAAREFLRIQNDAGLLVTVIRDPEVLEAVDIALFGGRSAEAVYEMGGSQDRVWRASAKPLDAAPNGDRRALLVLRDETDIRRAERTRADFLANASHELRTPLASLSGFIETLRGHARTDEKARDKFLAIMQAQAERMSRLIDDLLSLSRIELNEHIAPQGEVDLALAVMDVVDSLGPLAADKGVRLEADLPAAGTAISVGDRDQIVQVIQNLIDNGLKYSPSGGAVRIVLESGLTAEAAVASRNPLASRMSLLTPDHGHDLYGVIRVSDSGPGLAREHLPRLTERFYRVEGQKSGDRSGTGLGLAIVKHIMNRHRGGLAIESQEGAGATFTAYFPLISAVQATPRAAAPIVVTKVS
ncbi:ATP-binding protein [Phenylobacterium aquaticum]|uniref:ATP-binding protein n=1 Tax=Phenylobacterium aquaticum TaxID=1763816 RepID=UPI001F5E148C|nr:ATP-binding protein [Phenylobacterium aquaticum]MCI3134259.1 ATP-binding protein [Phenylobacterium aquaticum]